MVLIYVLIITLLTCCRENDISNVIEHTFCVDMDSFGEMKQHELKSGGKDIPVNEENKKEYVKYATLTILYYSYLVTVCVSVYMCVCVTVCV